MITKKLIIIFLLLLFVSTASAITINKNTFDGGSTELNISTNQTVNVTLLQGATITTATMSIMGTTSVYQEDADVTNCTSSDYTAPLGCDGNISTIGYDSFWDAKYDKHVGATGATWVIYTRDCNLSVAIPSDCWNYDTDSIYVMANYGEGYEGYHYQCANQSYDPSQVHVGTQGKELLLLEGEGCGGLYEEAIIWNTTISDVSVYVNDTLVYNSSGVLNTTATINLNTSGGIQNYLSTSGVVPLVFTAGNQGLLTLNNLSINYTFNNTASLVINSPSQITAANLVIPATIMSVLNISNNGNYNATNLSFSTVSDTATPNFNSLLSSNCTGTTISNGSTVLCSVTFTGITIPPEPDERLKISAVGTVDNQTVSSNLIDVDVTIYTGGGGSSGGGDPVIIGCGLSIVRPTALIRSVYCPPGSTMKEQLITLRNTEKSRVTVNPRFEGDINGCEFDSDSYIIDPTSTKNVLLSGCECPMDDQTISGKVYFKASQYCEVSLPVEISGGAAYDLALKAGIATLLLFLTIAIISWVST